MFAILLSKNMDPFYQTITSFPTVIYTGLLLFCLAYWIIAALGMIDIDFLDLDLDGDIDLTEGVDAQNALAGLLLKLGLFGVPLTIIISILAIIGWLFCYYLSFFLGKIVPAGLLQYLVGTVVFIGVTFFACLITAQIIKPIRNFFSKLDVDETKYIIGQSAIVRSAIVNNARGEAFLNDGGAGLILNIRSCGDEQFKKGDEVIILEELNDKNIYRVISTEEFNN